MSIPLFPLVYCDNEEYKLTLTVLYFPLTLLNNLWSKMIKVFLYFRHLTLSQNDMAALTGGKVIHLNKAV